MADNITINIPLSTQYVQGDEEIILTTDSGNDFYYTTDFTAPTLQLLPAPAIEPVALLPPNPFNVPPIGGLTVRGVSGEAIPFSLVVLLAIYAAYPYPLNLKGNGIPALLGIDNIQTIFPELYTVIKAISVNDAIPPPAVPFPPGKAYVPTFEFQARYIYPPKLSNKIYPPDKPDGWPVILPWPPADRLQLGDDLEMEQFMGADYEIMFTLDDPLSTGVEWNLWEDKIPTTPNMPDGEFEIKIYAYVHRKDDHSIKSLNKKHYIYLKP